MSKRDARGGHTYDMPAGICGRFFRILTSSPYPISPPPSLRSTRVVSNEGGTEPQILSCFSCGLVMKGAYGHRQSRVTGFEATRCAHVSHELKSSSISFLGTSNPSAGMALWNSARETCPSPFMASHERKRSSTRASEFSRSAVAICSEYGGARLPRSAGVQAAGRPPICCHQALPRRPQLRPVGRLRWFQVVARACQPPQVAHVLCPAQGACAGSAGRRPHTTGRQRGRHTRTARGAASGPQATDHAGSPVQPSDGFRRGQAARAVLPGHAGDDCHARDPQGGRSWALVRPHVRPR